MERLLLWNSHETFAINKFELFADDDNDFSNGTISLLGTFRADQDSTNQIPVQRFPFPATSTQYVHLNILSTHGSNSISAAEIAFEEIPFEFSPIPGITFLLGAGGINYFRLKKNSSRRQSKPET